MASRDSCGSAWLARAPHGSWRRFWLLVRCCCRALLGAINVAAGVVVSQAARLLLRSLFMSLGEACEALGREKSMRPSA